MGLFDIFKKKKKEEVQTTIQQTQVVEERELTDEEEAIWKFFYDLDDDLIEKVSFEKSNFIKLPDYQNYVNEYNKILKEIKVVAQRMIEEKKIWHILNYDDPELEDELMRAYVKKAELNDKSDLYEWLDDIDGNYLMAESIMKQRESQKRQLEHEREMEELNKQLNERMINSIISSSIEFERIEKEQRNRKIDRVAYTCKKIGLYTFDELDKLSRKELDELIEIQETAEEIVKNNPAELTGTLYSGQGKEPKDIFLQVKYAKWLMNGSGVTGKLYDYICTNVALIEGIYKEQKEKGQQIAEKMEELESKLVVKEEVETIEDTDEVRKGL